MDFHGSQEILCESIPISSSSDAPTNALFFQTFPEQCTDSIDLPKEQETLHGCKLWPTFEMVSLFDERINVVIPTGRSWINKVGPSNALVPFADGVGFSFKLKSASLHQSHAAVCAEEVYVTDPTIPRLNMSPRSLIWLSDTLNSEKHDLTKKVSKVGNFNVLTYNILSDIYVYTEKYCYCPEWALTWEYRRENLLRELIRYNADILCLQEVQSDHFENFFQPELEKHGYSAAYKRKTREVYTHSGYTIDGCATFYRNGIFKEVKSYELEYSKSALSLMEKLELSLRDQARVRLIKDNIALAVVLEIVGNSAGSAASFSQLCVVNTHIYAGKGSPDVKLLQVSDLVSAIEKTIDPKMPLFICGDLNSYPGSDPYILLTKHEVDIACADAPDPLCIFQHLKLHHSMNLASAYASPFLKLVNDITGRKMKMKHSKTGEPLFTRLTPFFGNTLDYIFYTVDSLKVEGLLELPVLESVGRALPSPSNSSDHIALMGNFRITAPFLG